MLNRATGLAPGHWLTKIRALSPKPKEVRKLEFMQPLGHQGGVNQDRDFAKQPDWLTLDFKDRPVTVPAIHETSPAPSPRSDIFQILSYILNLWFQ